MSAGQSPPTFPPEYLAEDIGYQLVTVAAVFTGLEIVAVILRFVSRRLARAGLGADDWLTVLGLLSCIALNAICIAMVQYGGIGRHAPAVLDKIVIFLKLQPSFVITYALAVMFPKLAIICLYLRIFISRSYKITCYVLISILVATSLAVIVTTFVSCIPLAYLWEPQLHPGGWCINLNAFWRWGSFPNIVTDAIMIVLPIPVIYQLQLSSKDKVGLILTFALGGIGLVSSCLRFAAFFDELAAADPTFGAIRLAIYGIAETGIYLIASCLPTYRAMYLYAKKRTGLTARSRSDRGSNKGTKGSVVLGPLQSHNTQKNYVNKSNGSSAGFELLEDERYFVDGEANQHNQRKPGIQVRHDFVVTSNRH